MKLLVKHRTTGLLWTGNGWTSEPEVARRFSSNEEILQELQYRKDVVFLRYSPATDEIQEFALAF
jgi:hypothetical protein